MQITNDAGRTFEIRVVKIGDRYGRDNCLVHGVVQKGDTEWAKKSAEHAKQWGPMIEFWDLTHAGTKGFGPEGQFVSRYYAKTLVEDYGRLVRHGLSLDGREPVWSVDAKALMPVLTLAKELVAEFRTAN